MWVLRRDVIEKRKEILEKAGLEPSPGRIIINHITNRRLENNKNTIFYLEGKNGEGKTWTALSFAEAIQAPHKFDVEKQIAYNPLQYRDVMKHALKKKKVKVVIFDEAQTFLSSKTYHDFINKTIVSIQTTFRELKPLVVIYIAPSFGDVDKSVRKQVDILGWCSRPLDYGTRVTLHELWTDNRDPENIRLRKKRMFVVRELEHKRWKTTILDKFIMSKPKPENIKGYKKFAMLHKTNIVESNLDALDERVRSEMYAKSKIDMLAENYIANPELVRFVTKNGKIQLKKLASLHHLTNSEAKKLRDTITEKLSEVGILEPQAVVNQ